MRHEGVGVRTRPGPVIAPSAVGIRGDRVPDFHAISRAASSPSMTRIGCGALPNQRPSGASHRCARDCPNRPCRNGCTAPRRRPWRRSTNDARRCRANGRPGRRRSPRSAAVRPRVRAEASRSTSRPRANRRHVVARGPPDRMGCERQQEQTQIRGACGPGSAWNVEGVVGTVLDQGCPVSQAPGERRRWLRATRLRVRARHHPSRHSGPLILVPDPVCNECPARRLAPRGLLMSLTLAGCFATEGLPGTDVRAAAVNRNPTLLVATTRQPVGDPPQKPGFRASAGGGWCSPKPGSARPVPDGPCRVRGDGGLEHRGHRAPRTGRRSAGVRTGGSGATCFSTSTAIARA